MFAGTLHHRRALWILWETTTLVLWDLWGHKPKPSRHLCTGHMCKRARGTTCTMAAIKPIRRRQSPQLTKACSWKGARQVLKACCLFRIKATVALLESRPIPRKVVTWEGSSRFFLWFRCRPKPWTWFSSRATWSHTYNEWRVVVAEKCRMAAPETCTPCLQTQTEGGRHLEELWALAGPLPLPCRWYLRCREASNWSLRSPWPHVEASGAGWARDGLGLPEPMMRLARPPETYFAQRRLSWACCIKAVAWGPNIAVGSTGTLGHLQLLTYTGVRLNLMRQVVEVKCQNSPGIGQPSLHRHSLM